MREILTETRLSRRLIEATVAMSTPGRHESAALHQGLLAALGPI